MSLGGFWRNLRGYQQPPGKLTIDIMAYDLMDLSVVLINLDDANLAELGWKRADQRRVFDALVAHSLARHQRGEPAAARDLPEPVTLSEEDWKRVFAIALEMKKRKPDDWPTRVIFRIAAETAKAYPKAGGERGAR